MCDHFYDIDDLDFASFADDNISYSCLSDMVAVFGQFKGGIDKIFDWFTKSLIIGSANTCLNNNQFKNPTGNREKIFKDIRLNIDYHAGNSAKKLYKIACSNSSLKKYINISQCKSNVSVLILSFNLNVS